MSRKISGVESRLLFLLSFLVVSIPWRAVAETRLHPLFQDRMVLQQQVEVPVWGWADPGEEVVLTFRGEERRATAGVDGDWRMTVPTGEAGGPFDLGIRGKTEVLLRDILVGEVWVCAGQSNMERSVSLEGEGQAGTGVFENPNIRLFQVKQATARLPQASLEGTWRVADPPAVSEFSAAGYFFGRELNLALKVPIGLIQATWDGSGMEAWSPYSSLEEVWDAKYLPKIEEQTRQSAAAQREHLRNFTEWVETAEKLEEKGLPVPPPPDRPKDFRRTQDAPTRLFNGMIAPLIPFAIRGVIWHQGESDANRAVRNTKVFPAMIRGWRREWKRGDFPFLYVQLNNFGKTSPEPDKSKWACFREEQLRGLAEPHTGMAVTIDIGDAKDIHPKNKREVARRLSLIALAKVYGREVPYSGPLYESMKAEEGRLRLLFQHIDGGLVARGNEDLLGFAVAGPDRRFRWASAEIEGDSIVVRNPEILQPLAVRYAWDDNPVGNLFNGIGLPASPFRTDDWPDAVREMR